MHLHAYVCICLHRYDFPKDLETGYVKTPTGVKVKDLAPRAGTVFVCACVCVCSMYVY